MRIHRGDINEHNTMLVNITHLADLQNDIARLVDDYVEDIRNAVITSSGYGPQQSLNNSLMQYIKDVFENNFDIRESFELIFNDLPKVLDKIKVFGINNQSPQVLDYSLYKKNGLVAIAIGGYKLSRGLTLEGLSISYFGKKFKNV